VSEDRLPTSSILIPSLGRPETLRNCLNSLVKQLHAPDEVIIVWQADDCATRDVALEFHRSHGLPIQVLHLEQPGIVPAENFALSKASGEIIVLIDDDAVAPHDWLIRHLRFYRDPTIGAVGGPANNFSSEGAFPKRQIAPVGHIHWTGKISGNMYDHVEEWASRPACDVDHLVGYNFSLRRDAFDRFDDNLRRYWQLFELEACLQVKSRGYRVVFDFANVVEHFPTNTAYAGGRDGNLQVKVLNSLYNRGYIFSKHFSFARRVPAFIYQILVGSVGGPGILGSCVASWRYGHPWRELKLLFASIFAFIDGWNSGARHRTSQQKGTSRSKANTSLETNSAITSSNR